MIYNSIVSPGCTIKGQVENSVISPGVWIDEHAVVRNSMLMGNVFIGQHSVVESCIMDDGVSVGRFCHISAKSSYPSLIDGIRILGKDMVVPSHTIISHNEAEWLDNKVTDCMAAIYVPELSGAVA
jgi:glucose-1-phosphate adenylyltransferase